MIFIEEDAIIKMMKKKLNMTMTRTRDEEDEEKHIEEVDWTVKEKESVQ